MSLLLKKSNLSIYKLAKQIITSLRKLCKPVKIDSNVLS